MILNSPFIISSRLLPALQVGGATIQLEYSKRDGRDSRTRYQWTIDLPNGQEFTGDDLQSGCQGGSLQNGFANLLSFLSASGDSLNYQTRTGREGENADLFPAPVVEWAAQNSDELSLLSLEIEESEIDLIEE